MANEPTYIQPRAHAHGEDQSMGGGQYKASTMPYAAAGEEARTGSLAIVHCHECWRYTDDMNRGAEMAKNAVTLLVNATPALEQTDAFRAADAYLARQFRRQE